MLKPKLYYSESNSNKQMVSVAFHLGWQHKQAQLLSASQDVTNTSQKTPT